MLEGSFPAFDALWARGLVTTAAYPVGEAWVNRNIDSRTRAKVISFREQAASIGEIGDGPPLGWLGNRFGVASAIVTSALFSTPAVGAYLRGHAGERVRIDAS